MSRKLSSLSRITLGWCFGVIALAITTTAMSQEAGSNPLGSLKDVSVPKPSDWSDFVKDNDQAVALGKALFWDNELGFDGQACATCHFHAGADSRIKNQISPHGESLQTSFSQMMSGAGGPNYTLRADDFPLFLLEDPEDRNSNILYDTDDVVSSMGVQKAIADNKGHPVTGEDGECNISPDFVFHVAGTNTRKVEPRNTPTVINAAFNFRNFWDGRANNRFNGVDVFGPRNKDARVLRNSYGSLESVSIDLENASLAAQAVGPVTSTLEMTCENRLFPEVGRKLLTKFALETQKVSPTDSVLGSYAASPLGLNKKYFELVQAAFKDEWWDSRDSYNGYTQMENNFSLFFGLALQAYQSTLISDDSPFDRFMHGDSSALSSLEQEGFGVFVGKGKCTACHDGPELSSAATHLIGEDEEGGLVERMSMAKLFNSDGSLSSPEPVNLALGKATSQSSLSSGGHPARAVDGQTSGTWNHGSVTHTSNQSQPWWQVDLGQGYDVSTVSLYNRTDCCTNRLSDFYVLTSGTDMTGRSLSDLLADSSVKSVYHEGAAPSLVDIHLSPENVRYVRVQLSGSNPLSLAEVEVYEADRFSALYDNGFYNIGVTPTREDVGVGANDPWGNPLSFTRQSKFRSAGRDDLAPDHFFINPDKLEVDSGHPIDPKENDAVDGSFKTPILRNLTLTGPYFHNGGTLTLEQLVEFYNRGGDRQRQPEYSDGDLDCNTTGFPEDQIYEVELGNDCSNLDPDIEHLDLSEHEKSALVAFLKTLTDDRVRWESAPFDHPGLTIPVGHVGDDYHVGTKTLEGGVVADDEELVLPAVGRNGRSVLGLQPLKPIQELMACAESDGNVLSCFTEFYAQPVNTVFKLDVNTSDSPTEEGFTPLLGNPGATVYESGVAFNLFGFHHGANRDRGAESSLLTDFAFNDGNGAGVGLRIIGLPAGRYQVQSWHYDAAGNQGAIKVEYRVAGGSPTVLVPMHDITNPNAASYTIESNGTDVYELVFREASHDRSRFNGIVIVPEGDFVEAENRVVMFEHADYRGKSWAVDLGEYPFAQVQHSVIGNDRISSMLVPEGLDVTVCLNDLNDLDKCKLFQGSVSNFNHHSHRGINLNDAISAFVVSPELTEKVTMFEHSDFGGRSWSVGVGEYTTHMLNDVSLNNRISSMIVPEGYKVEVCHHDLSLCKLFDGTVTSFSHHSAYGYNLNDAISSFRVIAPEY